MKKVVVAVTTLSLLAGVGASVALAERPDLTPTTFCHKKGTPAEKTMTLPRVAYEKGHKTHGDTEGACPGGGGGNPNPNPDHDVCEDIFDHLLEIAPDDVLAILDLAAVASVDDLVLALVNLEVVLGIDLDELIDEVVEGACDVLHLALHLKHKVLGVAFFATGEVLDLAGHVKHRALGVVSFAAGATSHVVGEAIELATDDVAAGVFVRLDAAVFNILDINASALAVVGLL